MIHSSLASTIPLITAYFTAHETVKDLLTEHQEAALLKVNSARTESARYVERHAYTIHLNQNLINAKRFRYSRQATCAARINTVPRMLTTTCAHPRNGKHDIGAPKKAWNFDIFDTSLQLRKK